MGPGAITEEGIGETRRSIQRQSVWRGCCQTDDAVQSPLLPDHQGIVFAAQPFRHSRRSTSAPSTTSSILLRRHPRERGAQTMPQQSQLLLQCWFPCSSSSTLAFSGGFIVAISFTFFHMQLIPRVALRAEYRRDAYIESTGYAFRHIKDVLANCFHGHQSYEQPRIAVHFFCRPSMKTPAETQPSSTTVCFSFSLRLSIS